MNHKRGKSKRSVRCTLCTPHRWQGNGRNRFDARTTNKKKVAKEEIDAR